MSPRSSEPKVEPRPDPRTSGDALTTGTADVLGARSREAVDRARPFMLRSSRAFHVYWSVVAITLRDHELRRAWVRATAPVAVLTLALGIFLVSSPATREIFLKNKKDDGVVVSVTDDPEKDGDATQDSNGEAAVDDEATTGASGATGATGDATPVPPGELPPEVAKKIPGWVQMIMPAEAKIKLVQAEAEAKSRRKAHREKVAAELKKLPAAARAAHGKLDATLEKLALEKQAAKARGESPGVTGDDIRQVVAAATEGAKAAEPAAGAGGVEPRWSWAALLSAFYGALVFVESVLLGLFRDHQEQLSRKLCLATGAEPEDPEARPRIRINFPWLRRKLKRRFRGALIVGSGLIPITLIALVPVVGFPLSKAATALWAVYWLSVFSLGAARLAWTHEDPGQPFFIRACDEASRTPVVGRVARVYGRVWAWLASTVRPGCRSLEQRPWEGLGLGFARALCALPVLNALSRPLLPVAAQLVLRGTTPTPPAPPALGAPS